MNDGRARARETSVIALDANTMQQAAKAASSASTRFAASDVPFLCVVGAAAASFWRGSWYTMDALAVSYTHLTLPTIPLV